MIDGDDLEGAILFGPWGLIGLILIVVVLIIVLNNEDECSKMTCPSGQTSTLMAHDCLCVTKAKP